MSHITRRRFHMGAAASVAGMAALSSGVFASGAAAAVRGERALSRILLTRDGGAPAARQVLGEGSDLFLSLGGKGESRYTAHLYGPEDKRVQVILPDVQTYRDPLCRVETEEACHGRDLMGLGPYLPQSSGTMLGEAQWAWLEEQLQVPARLRVIASDVQVLARNPGWEGWYNFPHERERLIGLIEKHRAEGVIFLSADTPWAELSRVGYATPYPLWDLTATGSARPDIRVAPNLNRWQGESVIGQTSGGLYVDWNRKDPVVTLMVRDGMGAVALQHEVSLSSLAFT